MSPQSADKLLAKKVTITSSTPASLYRDFRVMTTSGSESVAYVLARGEQQISDKLAKKAVLNHLGFLRAKGIMVVGTAEVARALSLPIAQVERVVLKLRPRGVKLIKNA